VKADVADAVWLLFIAATSLIGSSAFSGGTQSHDIGYV